MNMSTLLIVPPQQMHYASALNETQRASPRMDCKTGWRGSLEMNWVICLLREQIAAVYLGKVPSRAFTMGHIQSLMNDGYVQTKEQSSDQALFGNSGASSSQRHSANIKQIQVSGYRRADRCWPVRPSPHREPTTRRHARHPENRPVRRFGHQGV